MPSVARALFSFNVIRMRLFSDIGGTTSFNAAGGKWFLNAISGKIVFSDISSKDFFNASAVSSP